MAGGLVLSWRATHLFFCPGIIGQQLYDDRGDDCKLHELVEQSHLPHINLDVLLRAVREQSPLFKEIEQLH